MILIMFVLNDELNENNNEKSLLNKCNLCVIFWWFKKICFVIMEYVNV